MAAPTEATALPRWDLSPFFPAADSPELDEALSDVAAGIGALAELFDRLGVGGDGGGTGRDPAGAAAEVVGALNELLSRLQTVSAYLYVTVAADSRDDAAQERSSRLRRQQAELGKLVSRFQSWAGTLDVDDLVARSPVVADHEYVFRRAAQAAAHLMSRPEEELAGDLELTGSTAWSKLHRDLTSQVVVRLELRGEPRELSMSEVRALAHDPDRDVRRRAYEAELAAWSGAAVPVAAAMNSIKGEVGTLTRRRGWETPLDEAVWLNALDRTTLTAMDEAVSEALPELRRYFAAKARMLGVRRLAWYDLFAPLPAGDEARGPAWSFEQAREFVLGQFATYSERLRSYAERAFDERWIDAEPRPGKSDGAFCARLRGDESRILMNYAPAYGGMSTLAHELGHGYQNLVTAGLPPLLRELPMAVAETASTFCETIVREAALERAAEGERLEILEASLQDSIQITVDVTSRFRFEQRVLDVRRDHELSVSELCELMLDAQRETYGDGLEGDALHPYMWAVKPHYYGTYSYYNFPYAFGLLFGLALFASFRADPASFRGSYDDLLASTGVADTPTLATRFGFDVRSVDFWRSSLDVIRKDVERFEALTASAP